MHCWPFRRLDRQCSASAAAGLELDLQKTDRLKCLDTSLELLSPYRREQAKKMVFLELNLTKTMPALGGATQVCYQLQSMCEMEQDKGCCNVSFLAAALTFCLLPASPIDMYVPSIALTENHGIRTNKQIPQHRELLQRQA